MYELLKNLAEKPEPFSRYTAIELWTKPHLAEQMLKYHLNQDTDLASRKIETIDNIVHWIVESVSLEGKTLCDLGCGPGLYTQRFAEKGASVTGVDFSQRSIEYARQQAKIYQQDIKYLCANYLTDKLPTGFDVITLIYTDLCVLSPEQRSLLLSRIRKMLNPNGRLIFDVANTPMLSERTEFTLIEKNYMDCFWSDKDYIAVHKSHIYKDDNLALDHFVIFEQGSSWEIYNWFQHFTPESIQLELMKAGFETIQTAGGLNGEEVSDDSPTLGIIANKEELDDSTFLKQFEEQTLEPVHFSHIGHLRLAWLYLEKYDVDTAVNKICSGIKAYAESLGAHDKYHATITNALVRIIAKRIDDMKIATWEEFLKRNPDLISDAMSVLKEYYSEALLKSESAKNSQLTPDIKSIA